ncbi:MAG: M3 family oligoendopeptidase [Alphaproteobacteria bacterium]
MHGTAVTGDHGSDSGRLPEWNLDDLYPGRDSQALKDDLKRAAADAAAFEGRYKGRLGALAAEEFAAAIRGYETIDERLARLMSYAQLAFSIDMDDPEVARFYQMVQERTTDISTHLLFFVLELNRLDDAAVARLLENAEARRYAPWVRNVRQFRAHQLSDEAERLLHEKHISGRASWIRLFDETLTALRFPLDGRELIETEILHLLSDKDRETRRKAAHSLGHVLGENIRTFSLITNTLAKDKEIEDRWRHYESPVSHRNLSNQVENEVVEALVKAVTAAYPGLSHRYYAIKARWLGLERLEFWDRNAPLPEDEDRVIPWPEAKETVLSAYGAFSGELAEIGGGFFTRPWIDAGPRAGKASGAFSHPTVPSVHPYILMNYQGKTRDVMTLAHELGHGVHQVLAGPQGHFLSDTPLTLAETASVFGEMLTFRALLERERAGKRRRVMLATKVEDMLNTVVRQVAMFEFERRVHAERREGEVTAGRLGEIWLETQRESLGPAVNAAGDYRHFWAYIPHFIHSPFYVYAYAFGDCLVNSLYSVYQGAPAGFVEKYLAMLRAGGTLRHKELLAPFGLDASDPAFWGRGLSVIAGLIDELEGLE